MTEWYWYYRPNPRIEKEAISLPQSLAPAAVGLSLLGPMVNPPSAEAVPAQSAPMTAPYAAPETQEAQQGPINKASVERALNQIVGRPITFRTEDGSKDGTYGWADWEKNLIVLDWRLASKIYALPKVNNDEFYGTAVALATLAHEAGHVALKDNRSEYAATRWGCNHLNGLLTGLGVKDPLKKKLVAAAWQNLNVEYGCRNRRDLR